MSESQYHLINLTFSNRTAFRLAITTYGNSVCVCENDNFEPRDWSTRLPEFKTGSAVQTGIQQSV